MHQMLSHSTFPYTAQTDFLVPADAYSSSLIFTGHLLEHALAAIWSLIPWILRAFSVVGFQMESRDRWEVNSTIILFMLTSHNLVLVHSSMLWPHAFRIDWKLHTIGRQEMAQKSSLLLTENPKDITSRKMSPSRKQAAIVNEIMSLKRKSSFAFTVEVIVHTFWILHSLFSNISQIISRKFFLFALTLNCYCWALYPDHLTWLCWVPDKNKTTSLVESNRKELVCFNFESTVLTLSHLQ